MAEEIERKFRVAGEAWRDAVRSSQRLRQGYLSTTKERTVRVRIRAGRAHLTVKGITIGTSRREFEYEIPVDDATTMLDDLCERPLIEKTRHIVEHEGFTWEVDEFEGANAGLVIAEVELASEDQQVPLPDWIGDEVSDDPRYFNANLIEHPFCEWGPPGG